MEVYGTFSSRGQSHLRKMNSNMDSEKKKQSDIVYAIEMTSECAVFPQKEYEPVHEITNNVAF